MKNNHEKKAASEVGAKPTSTSRIVWAILFIFIAALTIWTVTSQSKSFSVESFVGFVSEASKPWLIAAFAAAIGFIVFEGEAVRAMCRGMNYNTSHGRGLIYSASDIYFSAITPSATGGQPASAYFMIADGIPAAVTTAILVINLLMYTLSIVIISIIAFIIHPELFLSFSVPSRILIIIGFAVQLVCLFIFITLMKNGKILHKIGTAILSLLSKMKLIRNKERKQGKLNRMVENYNRTSQIIQGKKKMLLNVFIFNFLQRASSILVIVFTYLASGGPISKALDIFSMQSYVVIGSNSIPIPGAMGVSDYLMIDGFGVIGIPEADIASLELLSRSISFYFCVILCGIAFFAAYLVQKRRRKKL